MVVFTSTICLFNTMVIWIHMCIDAFIFFKFDRARPLGTR